MVKNILHNNTARTLSQYRILNGLRSHTYILWTHYYPSQFLVARHKFACLTLLPVLVFGLVVLLLSELVLVLREVFLEQGSAHLHPERFDLFVELLDLGLLFATLFDLVTFLQRVLRAPDLEGADFDLRPEV